MKQDEIKEEQKYTLKHSGLSHILPSNFKHDSLEGIGCLNRLIKLYFVFLYITSLNKEYLIKEKYVLGTLEENK